MTLVSEHSSGSLYIFAPSPNDDNIDIHTKLMGNGVFDRVSHQEHDKQLFLLEQLQRQKLELEQQKREFEERQQRVKQAELQVSCMTG